MERPCRVSCVVAWSELALVDQKRRSRSGYLSKIGVQVLMRCWYKGSKQMQN